jgi:hypothetical protein
MSPTFGNDGGMLISPDGSTWRIEVANDGTLSSTLVSEALASPTPGGPELSAPGKPWFEEALYGDGTPYIVMSWTASEIQPVNDPVVQYQFWDSDGGYHGSVQGDSTDSPNRIAEGLQIFIRAHTAGGLNADSELSDPAPTPLT